MVKTVKNEDVGIQYEVTPIKDKESYEIKPKSADTRSTSVKKIVKRKIIKTCS